MTNLYTGAWVGLAYVLTAILLGLGVCRGGHVWFFAGISLFTIWDIGWLLVDRKARDRSAKDMLDSSTRARTYMSYFMAVYGAVLAFVLFQSTPEQRRTFFQLCHEANIHPFLFGIPFALTGLSLFFFLIALGSGNGSDLTSRPPSAANITIVVWAAWAQKTATFTFMYAVLRLLYYTWLQSLFRP
jgi:hypothetical protein